MRKLVATVLATVGALLLGVPAHAASTRPVVDVIQIGGLLDAVQADFWQHAIRDADAHHAAALIVQLNSPRAVTDTRRLERAIRRASTPVAVWVGPGRSAHAGADLLPLLRAGDVVGAAPGADVALQAEVHSPTLGDFLVDLDGRVAIDIPTKVIRTGKTPQREPLVDVRFSKPSLIARMVHGVTSPGPAYALLVVGLLLAVLEFTTAGVGLAAATAALLLVLAALGLGGLPVNGVAAAAIVFAALAFAIDVQAGAPRAWTGIGTAALIAGSFTLFHDGMSVPLLWNAAVLGLAATFVLAGLPSLIRARFSSPTIGRESFVGELGTAVGALSPEGVVRLRGATWRARTNRATPVPDGDPVRVVGIDGLVLDVEPEVGGAKDYRERSKPTT